MKVVGWFSGGATSAVAIKKAIDFGCDVDIYFMETGSHHNDNLRFLKDCENWFGQKIITLKNKKYKDVFDVIRKTKYINSPMGARCTLELKKNLRIQLEKMINYDYQIFGFEYETKQINRAIRFNEQYPDAKGLYPLIELGMTKDDCFNELNKAGIELPMMYKLGFSNANCIGCVKGGAGYWNHVRKNFPEHFNEMAKIEREIGRSCIKRKFLDQLDVNEGRHESIVLPECGAFCQLELSGLSIIDDAKLVNTGIFKGC
jgi:hypothetical protein